MKTLSERLFENFCESNSLLARPIEKGRGRTADYEVDRLGRSVIFEIKEIRPPDGPSSDFQRSRIREILKHASPQLKDASKSGKPGVLVIYNNTRSTRMDPDDCLQAMFGRKQTRVRFDGAVSDPFLAGNEGCTPQHNTSLSALAVLRRENHGTLLLDVFHNPFAAVRLQPTWFSNLPVRQVVAMNDGRFPQLSRLGSAKLSHGRKCNTTRTLSRRGGYGFVEAAC